MRVVVDTNILVKGFSEFDMVKTHLLLHYFYHKPENSIVIDHGDIVRKEYYDEVGHIDLFQKWYTFMVSNNQIEYHDGKLPKKIAAKLKELGFHEHEDQTFVALALNTDNTIITEDSDYGKGKPEKAEKNLPTLRYMEDELELRVLDAEEATRFLESLNS
ncbi:hypothetical protein [Tumebacillus flagellatus]|uniref:PIN domain-containing protein n=1 Tax=Tumebacillus flagellatus TaxID=1157490 RepID=A0A074LSP1_9BACL|nr:hypothetical protein [Tumebacillus flagellatus]KEO82828.1 hypothetical protein EL26_13035 [Tumebacillus flagellatus]